MTSLPHNAWQSFSVTFHNWWQLWDILVLIFDWLYRSVQYYKCFCVWHCRVALSLPQCLASGNPLASYFTFGGSGGTYCSELGWLDNTHVGCTHSHMWCFQRRMMWWYSSSAAMQELVDWFAVCSKLMLYMVVYDIACYLMFVYDIVEWLYMYHKSQCPAIL